MTTEEKERLKEYQKNYCDARRANIYMRSKTLNKDEICTDKKAFLNNKSSISIDKVEINRIVLLNKTLFGNKGSFKHYIGYRHVDGNFSPINIKIPQLTGYAKHFNNGDKLIYSLIADKELLKKYNETWDKIKSLFKKEFDKKPVYDNKYISAKINGTQFEHRILRDNRHCNIFVKPKNKSRHEYLSVMFLDPIFIYPHSYCSNKNYPQIFFEKCTYTKNKESELLGIYMHY